MQNWLERFAVVVRGTLTFTAAVGLGAGVCGQSTFNVVQPHPSTLSYNGSMSVFELSDGYLVFSFGWSLDSTVGAVHITKHDLEGNYLWLKEHRRDRNTQPGIIDPIARISGDRFVGAMTEYGGDDPKVTYLYWWNSAGDTLITKFFKSDSSAIEGSHGTRQLVALADGGFLHCGWCSDPINTGCITRLDSTGAILWEQLYTNTNTIQNATPLADGGFILGGSRNGQVDIAVVIRTDSLGAVQWTRYHGLYSVTGGERALVSAAGNVLMPGSWKDDPSTATSDRWASLYEYVPDGTFIGRKDYVYSYNATAVHVLPKGDDHYWLVGGIYQYGVDPDVVMLLWELDENLDSLWTRRYWYYEPDGAENAAYCVRSTMDGGLIMCGVTRQGVTDPRPYLQSNWLIKLDSYGCLVPGCQSVGVQEYALGLQGALQLAPNPVAAGAPLRVTFEPPAGFKAKGPLRVVVLDALGKEVHAEELGSNSTSNTLNIVIPAHEPGQLSTGLYYVHLTDGTSWLAGGKVVVE